ncbi:Hypothetical predicted protein [Mytilus galloprovincialis]|uniref:Reverse transcriptase domain-containing protein n=1 Tax=Mytilus galloprovincialis TaxID=29158 RepID=A0A8B6D2C7_MYTGA|nr:Hypothetical predicted protein [Mytilus galloprovincialis]
MYMKNNKSALKNDDFVSKSVNELVLSGCVIEVPFQPYIVNPLSVATQKSGKRRLILDLSTLNLSVKKEKIKFEDWKIAVQYFQKNDYLYKFDLKSGYFHLDICPQQHTYLGFSWEDKFYCFTVLAFGLSTGPYIFTKCLRPLVKYWRKNGIKIVLYLDDGFGMNNENNECIKDAEFVKQSLLSAGFLLNEEKSVFTPVQKLEWLGIIWDSCNFTLCIPQRRIDELFQSIHNVFREIPYISARNLAQVTGRIISMSPVIGNITRIMTRYCYMSIESRMSWDSYLVLESKSFVISELKFWLDNIANVNFKTLNQYSQSHVMVYSDASSIAAGACTVELESKIFHTMWKSTEMLESSTWRELKAIELALMSYQHAFAGKSLKWLTDNQNCVRIVQAGSMKEKLQDIAISIFSICLQKGISINIQWIPRGENSKADYISKIIDYEDWGVSEFFYTFINDLWGPYTVDRFASSRNTKLERFNSLFWNVNTEAVDCFTQNWSGENNWIVPPIYLVLRAIKHVIACKARDIFRVGRWKQNSDISDELSTLKARLPEYCLSSRSLNTRKKYQYAFNAFCSFPTYFGMLK